MFGVLLINEMVVGKFDFGVMVDFFGVLNGVVFCKVGCKSVFIMVFDGSIDGSGNGIVVLMNLMVCGLVDLKGKMILVLFVLIVYGMLLCVIKV